MEGFLDALEIEGVEALPSTSLLDDLEDYLVFSVDAEVSRHTDRVLNFLCRYIGNVEIAVPREYIKVQNRMFKMLGMLRPNVLSSDQSNRLYNVTIKVLEARMDERQGYALTVLVSHMVSWMRDESGKVCQLFELLTRRLSLDAGDFDNADIGFICILLESVVILLSVLNSQTIPLVPPLAEQVVKIVREGLARRKNHDFFERIRIVVSKGLRFLGRLLERMLAVEGNQMVELVSQDAMSAIVGLRKEIPDDPRFSLIYMNYLTCACQCVKQNDPHKGPVVDERLFDEVAMLLPVLTRPPFAGHKRSFGVIMGFCQLCKRVRKHPIAAFDRIFSNIWPMIADTRVPRASYSLMLRNIVFSVEIFKQNHDFGYCVLEYICCCLRILRSSFAMLDQKENEDTIDISLWTDMSRETIKVLPGVMNALYSSGQASRLDYAVISCLTRVTDYVVFMLEQADIVSSDPDGALYALVVKRLSHYEFQRRIRYVIDTLCKTVSALPAHILKCVISHIALAMMPVKRHDRYRVIVHQLMVNAVTEPGLYHATFFSVIVANFESLFIPEGSHSLRELTLEMFNDAFVAEKQIAPESQTGPPVVTQITRDLFMFVMKSVCSKKLTTVKLVCDMFQCVYQRKCSLPRLAGFFRLLEKCPFSVSSLLRLLIDDEKIAAQLSMLALFMCPHCGGELQLDRWLDLFIAALDSPTHRKAALRVFHRYGSERLAQAIGQKSTVRRSVLKQLVMSITSAMTAGSEEDAQYAKELVNEVMRMATTVSLRVNEPKCKPMYVTIDERTLRINILIDAIKEKECVSESDIRLLTKCYASLVNSMLFGEAITDRVLADIATMMYAERPETFEQSESLLIEAQLYTHVFFLCKHFGIDEDALVARVSNPEYFLDLCLVGCNHPLSATAAAGIIGVLLRRCIPFGPPYCRANLALFHASIYAYKEVKTLIRKTMLLDDIATDDAKRVVNKLCSQYQEASIHHNRQYRRLATFCMNFYESNHKISCYNIERRDSILKRLPGQMVTRDETGKDRYRYSCNWDSVVNCSVKGVQSTSQIATMIIEAIEKLPIRMIPQEIQDVFKNMMYADESMVLLSSFELGLRVAVKLCISLPVCPATSMLWDKILVMIRQKEVKSVFTLLTKFAQKELKIVGEKCITSLPCECVSVFNSETRSLPSHMCGPEEVRIMRFICRFGITAKRRTQILEWLKNSFRALAQKPQRSDLTVVAVELCQLLVELHRIWGGISFVECVVSAVEVGLHGVGMVTPIRLPLHLIAEELPELFMGAFCANCGRAWLSNYAVVFMDLLLRQSLKSFRSTCLRMASEHARLLMTFVGNLSRFSFEALVSHVLCVAAARLEDFNDDDINFGEVIRLFVNILTILKEKDVSNCTYKPALFLFCEMFMPMNFLAQFTLEFDAGNLFIGQALPLILATPSIFDNELFLDRFSKFMKKLSVDFQMSAFNEIVRWEANGANEKTFSMTLIGCMQRFIPTKEQFVCQAGFTGFPRCERLEALRMNYAAMNMISSHGGKDLSDAGDCTIVGTCSSVDADAVLSGRFDLSMCHNLSRLLHVSHLVADRQSDIVPSDATSQLLTRIIDEAMSMKLSLSIFRGVNLWHQLLVDCDRRLTKHVLATTTMTMIMTRGVLLDRVTIYSVLDVLQIMSKGNCDYCAMRIFEITLVVADKVLRRLLDLPAGKKVSAILDNVVPLIRFVDPLPEILGTVRSLIMDKTELEHATLDIRRREICLYILSSLSPVLYFGEPDIPCALQAKYIKLMHSSKIYSPMLQECIQKSGLYGGTRIVKLITNEVYTILKQRLGTLTEPDDSMFACAAKWLNEISIRGDDTTLVTFFLRAAVPQTELEFVRAVRSLKEPVNRVVATLVRETYEKAFQTAPIYGIRQAQVIFARTSANIVDACFMVNWSEMHSSTHIETFAYIVMPEDVIGVIPYLSMDRLRELIANTATSLCVTPGFEKFMWFYSELCPRGPLTEVLWTIPSLTGTLPVHGDSLMANCDYLITKNLCEDGLGLLKCCVPALSHALWYHQLSNYRAAKSYYLMLMEKHEECYFHGLVQLRNIVLGMSLPTKVCLQDKSTIGRDIIEYRECLPFLDLKLTSNSNDFTDVLSQVHSPLLLHCAISHEIGTWSKVIHQHVQSANYSEDVRRVGMHLVPRTLDKQNGASLLYTWRLVKLHELIGNLAPVVGQPVHIAQWHERCRAAIASNRGALSLLLAKTGEIKHAVKQYSLSVSMHEGRQFPVTRQTAPRVTHFLGTVTTANMRSFGFMVVNRYIRLCRFQEIENAIAAPRPHLRKQWIATFIAIFMIDPKCMDPATIFQRIRKEMEKVMIDHNMFLISACVALVRREPAFREPFIQHILANPTDHVQAYMQWLPSLFQICETLPSALISNLVQLSTSYFMFMLVHARYSGMVNDTYCGNILQELQSRGPEVVMGCRGYKDAMKWVERNRGEIETMTGVVASHLKLYEKLSANETGDDIAELADFCAKNSPVFKPTTVVSPCESISGFRFPDIPSEIMAVYVSGDGVNNAVMQMLSVNGTTRRFPLCSPLLYRFSHAEQLFVAQIGKMVDNHPAVGQRTKGVGYPLAFLVHRDLLMVHLSSLVSQSCLADPSLPLRLVEASLSDKDRDESPVSVRARRTVDIDRTFLLRRCVHASGGRKVDFLSVRASFAAHLGAFSALHFIFSVPLSTMPNVCILDHGAKVCMPGFMNVERGVPQMALTASVRNYLPNYVIAGSLATEWQIISDVIARHSEKVSIFLAALCQPDAILDALSGGHHVINTATKLATQMTCDTEKTEDTFPFRLFEHLVDTVDNSLCLSHTSLSWL